ncbi:MAG: hypothetical protein NTV01_07630 [Bacteroidia bacterium]|nr:hypothetical protein [Bacteroidia bacterium]
MDLTDLFRVKDPDVNADYSLMMDCEMGEVMRFVMNYKSGKKPINTHCHEKF